MMYIVFICSIIVIHNLFKWNKWAVESLYIGLSCALFALGLTLERYSIIKHPSLLVRMIFIISFLLPIFARLFFGVLPGTLTLEPQNLYYPPTAFDKMLKQHPDLRRTALITTPKGAEIHPNTPMILGVAGITGYRNSLLKDYMEVFHYHRLFFENQSNVPERYSDFQKRAVYLSNYLQPLQAPQKIVKLSKATKNYFLIHGVDSIIGADDLNIIDPDWIQLGKKNKLSLWKYQKKQPEFIFSRSIHYIKEPIEQLNYMFLGGRWEPEKEILVREKNVLSQESQEDKMPKIKILEKTDGYRRIDYEKNNAPGILMLPVTYGARWHAQDISNHQLLKTFKVNYAFLGVLIPKGSGEIELIYNDRATLVNQIISGLGSDSRLRIF